MYLVPLLLRLKIKSLEGNEPINFTNFGGLESIYKGEYGHKWSSILKKTIDLLDRESVACSDAGHITAARSTRAEAVPFWAFSNKLYDDWTDLRNACGIPSSTPRIGWAPDLR